MVPESVIEEKFNGKIEEIFQFPTIPVGIRVVG
jgi:hypothetical protein